MIEISFGKLLVLALIALIVLGPEKLPAAARTAGALVRRLRGSWDSVRAEVERELQVDDIRRTAREAAARVDAAQSELDATLLQVRDVAANVARLDAAAEPANAVANAAGPSEQSAVVTADRDVVAADAPADTGTGDLFAGPRSQPLTVDNAPTTPAEPSHGAD